MQICDILDSPRIKNLKKSGKLKSFRLLSSRVRLKNKKIICGSITIFKLITSKATRNRHGNPRPIREKQ